MCPKYKYEGGHISAAPLRRAAPGPLCLQSKFCKILMMV